MFHINPDTPKIIKAEKAFKLGMRKFVDSRIDNIDKLKRNGNDIDIPKIRNFFDSYIRKSIEDLLIGKPDKLIKISNGLSSLINDSADIRKGIEYVFNYDIFKTKAEGRYDAYKLAESLDIRTCTYCNRIYTNTVIRKNGKKIIRPQFDHYFGKAKHPVLAISFYNLIPSCSICNSNIKGTHEMGLNDYMHPYIDNSLNDICFTYEYSIESKLRIKVKTQTTKARNTIDAFAIEEVYNAHILELLDLVKTRQYFSDKYLSILRSNLLDDIKVSKEDLYRIVFGTEYNSDNFINRPFSKFKSDILKELGII